MHSPEQIDMQSVYGTTLSILCLFLAHIFESMTVLIGLQGLAYVMTILIAIDTLSGNKLKQWLGTKFRKNANKSKRSKPH